MLLADATQIRRSDQIMIEKRDFPGILLMETAGRLATERLLPLFPKQNNYLILVGPGNNGGDGLVMARRLHLAGYTVFVLFSHSPNRFQGDALINFQIFSHLNIPQTLWEKKGDFDWQDHFRSPPIIIDALLGTGISSHLRGTVLEIIEYFKEQTLECVAVDLPSGMDASSGQLINPMLKASHTFSFQLPKICHFVTPAANYCGKVHVLDIGIWPEIIAHLGIERQLLDKKFVAENSIPRKSDSHKGSFGHVLLIGGSRNMAGAISLSAAAALRSGVGLCTVICPSSCRQALLARNPEVMCIGIGEAQREFLQKIDLANILPHLAGKTAVAIGPGMGHNEETAALLEHLLPQINLPLLLDADALNLLAMHPRWWQFLGPDTVLSPHPGEMSRLQADPDPKKLRLESVESLAREQNIQVILKGKNTLIASPDGSTFVNPTGNSGMASGGSGDVLTGIVGALLALGYSPKMAASIGVWHHGLAGDAALENHTEAALIASDLIAHLEL